MAGPAHKGYSNVENTAFDSRDINMIHDLMSSISDTFIAYFFQLLLTREISGHLIRRRFHESLDNFESASIWFYLHDNGAINIRHFESDQLTAWLVSMINKTVLLFHCTVCFIFLCIFKFHDNSVCLDRLHNHAESSSCISTSFTFAYIFSYGEI